jgi:mono/diheme cytochrome c family protein
MALVLLSVALVSGCEPDPYPEDLKYPLRTDILVVSDGVPTKRDIPYPHALGTFPQSIQDLESDKKEKDRKNLDPADLPGDAKSELEGQLDKLFGTPREPTIEPSSKADRTALKKLEVDKEGTMARGSVLYRRHCVHCHGLTGDGRGPTATWVNPHPRDYRPGYFKFTSILSGGKGKALRSDLLRTLKEGIEGTSMPNFRLLADEERHDLVSYVMHLSIRGTVEISVMKDLLEKVKQAQNAGRDVDKAVNVKRIPRSVQTALSDTLKEWTEGTRKVPVEPYPEEFADPQKFQDSVRRGFELFIDPKGATTCRTCHNDYGRQSGFMYDKWGTLDRPADLTAGVYRGGRRPIDLYYRVRGGIGGTQMPETEKIGDDPKNIWHLVNFIRALPYPKMLPPDVREQIYGPKQD